MEEILNKVRFHWYTGNRLKLASLVAVFVFLIVLPVTILGVTNVSQQNTTQGHAQTACGYLQARGCTLSTNGSCNPFYYPTTCNGDTWCCPGPTNSPNQCAQNGGTCVLWSQSNPSCQSLGRQQLGFSCGSAQYLCCGGPINTPACGSTCENAASCANASGGCTACVGGKCTAPTKTCGSACSGATSCSSATGGCTACVGGKCTTPPTPTPGDMCGNSCSKESDCTGGSGNTCTHCKLSTGKCVAPVTPTPTPADMCGNSCSKDSDCTGGNGNSCKTCDTSTHTCVGPTPTPGSGSITFHLTISQPGIALIPNKDPNTSYKINDDPVHKQRDVTLYFYSATDNSIPPSQDTDGSHAIRVTATNAVQYDATSGNFSSDANGQNGFTVDPTTATNGTLQTGTTYNVLVKMNQDLRINVGAHQLNADTTLSSKSQPVYMVTGDLNSDNSLDILDYNQMIACFPNTHVDPSICNAQQADLNDKPLQIAPTPSGPTTTEIPTGSETGAPTLTSILTPSDTPIVTQTVTQGASPTLTAPPTATLALSPSPTGTGTMSAQQIANPLITSQNALQFWNDQLAILLQMFVHENGQ